MDEMVDSSGVQYAVIAGLRTETGIERLVIAYPSEESLRDLIAPSSIIALGFSSREEAVTDSRASVPTAVAFQRAPAAIAAKELERPHRGFNWAGWHGEADSTLRRLVTFLVTSYGDIAATAAVIFSSSNSISAVIRMALGSSV